MSKYKIGDEVEAVSKLANPDVNKGDRFTVAGHYEVRGYPGLVVDGPRGLQLMAESHVKPVPPKPPVPVELWVNYYDGYRSIYDSEEHANRGKRAEDPNRIDGKAWRYVLADNQEDSK